MDEVSVIIRPFCPETDEACVYSTWRNASYYGMPARNSKTNGKEFFRKQTALIRDILKNAYVRVACLKDDPMTIIGYSVTTDKHLDFIYVKVEYRNKGIGRLLMPKNIQTVTNRLTKIGLVLVDKNKFQVRS